VAFLGRIPGMRRFSDMERNPENEPVPGALLFRVEASLFYFNADAVREEVEERLRTSPQPVRFVVLDLSTTPRVDMAGAEMLKHLYEDLEARGVTFQVVEARAKVRDMLRTEGLEERLGHISRRHSLAEAVEEFEAGKA
jgi:MFS superfamily sulfate permease-like transporter